MPGFALSRLRPINADNDRSTAVGFTKGELESIRLKKEMGASLTVWTRFKPGPA